MRKFILILSTVLAISPTTVISRTLTDDQLPNFGALDLIDPLSDLGLKDKIEAWDKAIGNFEEATNLLEENLRATANYASILAVAPELRTYIPKSPRLLFLHSIALSASNQMDQARAAMKAARGQVVLEQSTLPDLAQAMILYREGKLDQAERHLQDVILADSDHAYAFNLLGTVQFSAGDLQNAENNFKRASELTPDSVTFLRNLGLVRFQQGQRDLALDALKTALAQDRTDCISLTALAQVYEASQQFDVAEEQVKACLQSNPTSGLSAGYLVSLQVEQDAFEDALKTVDKYGSVLSDPAALNAEIRLKMAEPQQALDALDRASVPSQRHQMQRAFALAMLGDLEAANSRVEQARLTTPNDASTALVAIALSVAENKPIRADLREIANSDPDMRASLAYFEALAAANSQSAASIGKITAGADGMLPGTRFTGVPENDWIAMGKPEFRKHAALGALWLLRANDKAARESFTAIETSEPIILARYFQAIAETRLGDPKAALATLEIAGSAAPEFFSAQVLLGELFLGQGRVREAFDSYRNAMAVVEDGGVLMRVGLIADGMNELDIAEDAFRRFIALFPESFIGYNQLSWLFIQREIRLDDALALAEKADTIQPGNASIMDNIGWVYYLQGDTQTALEKLREADRVSGSANPDILYHLAVVEANAGFPEKSTKLLRRFIELPTENHAAAEKARNLLRDLN